MSHECRHIMPNGAKCQATALRGKPYCYLHTRSRKRRPNERGLQVRTLARFLPKPEANTTASSNPRLTRMINKPSLEGRGELYISPFRFTELRQLL